MPDYRLFIKLLILLTGLIAAPAPADVSLRIMGNNGTESTVQVSRGRCRLEITGMPGYALIDTRNQSFTYVNPARAEYASLGKAQLHAQLEQINRIGKSVAPHMEAMRGNLQTLPPERRALLEQFIANQPATAAGPRVQLLADRGIQRLAGLSCVRHRMIEGGRQVGDVCLLQQASTPLPAEDYTTLDTALSMLRELSGQFGGLLAQAGHKSVLLDTRAHGIPIALRDYTSGESYRLVAAVTRRIDERLFNNHLRYRQVDATLLSGLF